jgi:alkyl hydroperoxide reductase subunit AhpC
VSKLYGMLPAGVSGEPTERTPADNQTVRNVFVVGPDMKIKLVLVYRRSYGPSSSELTAQHKVVGPARGAGLHRWL